MGRMILVSWWATPEVGPIPPASWCHPLTKSSHTQLSLVCPYDQQLSTQMTVCASRDKLTEDIMAATWPSLGVLTGRKLTAIT